MSTYVERLEHQLAQAKHRHPANNATISRLCTKLGDQYVRLGDIAKAETVYAEAYEIRLSIYGPNHLRVAISLNGLAICYIRQATTQTTKRKCLLRQAQRSLEEVLRIQILAGERCAAADLATTYHNLGIVLSKLGKLHRNEALTSFQKALSIRIGTFGNRENLSVAETMTEMGKIYVALGDLGHARLFAEEALCIRCRHHRQSQQQLQQDSIDPVFSLANAAAAAA